MRVRVMNRNALSYFRIAMVVGMASMIGFAAHALDRALIVKAKSQCLVGESASGYLGFPSGSAAPDIQREVREVNLKRKAKYAELAKRGGVTIEVAAALTGEKLIARAAKGECIQTANGQWIKVK